jgi:DNA-binding transcriptional LysR family regulator
VKDLNLLYVFEAMWRERSVTEAAESLGVTQAAVSSSLKRLRTEYGDKLFTQIGRRMEPTPLASTMSPQLLDALAMVRKTHTAPTVFDPAQASRTFTVRTRDIGEVVCFPGVLAELGRSAPGIKLKSVFRPIDETLAGMASGHIDLALGFLPSLETAIHRRKLFSQHYVCAMRADHPLSKVPLDLDAFLAQEHLLVEYSGSGHLVLEKALVEAGVKDRIRVRMQQYLSAPHFIISSDMLWSVPAMLAETLARHFPLVIKPHPLTLPSFEVALYWHDRYHQDPANRWLRELLIARLCE